MRQGHPHQEKPTQRVKLGPSLQLGQMYMLGHVNVQTRQNLVDLWQGDTHLDELFWHPLACFCGDSRITVQNLVEVSY